MNASEENQDPLDELLRENDEHVADAGFTSRVMKNLPVRRKPFWRTAILLLASFAGLAICVLFALNQWDEITALFTNGLNGISSPASQQALLTITGMGIATVALIMGIFSAVNSEE